MAFHETNIASLTVPCNVVELTEGIQKSLHGVPKCIEVNIVVGIMPMTKVICQTELLILPTQEDFIAKEVSNVEGGTQKHDFLTHLSTLLSRKQHACASHHFYLYGQLRLCYNTSPLPLFHARIFQMNPSTTMKHGFLRSYHRTIVQTLYRDRLKPLSATGIR